MTSIEHITLEVPEIAAAQRFYDSAFGLGEQLRLREGGAPSAGFRWFTVSLVVSQPSIVRRLVGDALDAGATELKPAKKSFWGFGGVVQAPDGTVWKVASSGKKDTGRTDSRQIDEVVLLLGTADMDASKRFYVERGFTVAKSYGRKYTEFDAASSPVKLALYPRKGIAKDAGVPPEGTGSHRLAIGGGGSGEAFTDPDGFAWEPAAQTTSPSGPGR